MYIIGHKRGMENMDKIIGRENEKKILKQVMTSDEPEFLAVYGRRRVGKTFLIREYFKKSQVYFEITGLQAGQLHDQLENFISSFCLQFSMKSNIPAPESWNNALKMLINEVTKKKINGKMVFFFDELPWLAYRKSHFLQALEYFWNSWASKKKNVIVIVCGSAASWMLENIVNNKGGLHNRITKRIRLLPFTLKETNDYLKSRKINLDRKQILEIYLGLGGVPHYLKQIEKGQSAIQNINRICFTKDGILVDEFNKLYQSLFEHSENYIDVIKALAKKRMGLTRDELLVGTQMKSGGGISKILSALEESGFISKIIPFGKKANAALYKLTDEYSLFYLTWILSAPKGVLSSTKHDYWLQQRAGASWRSWSGYAFEGVCQKHVYQMKMGLGISGINTMESSWYYRPANKKEKGAQIDLIIDRSDNCITICEMKYSDLEFITDKKYSQNLKDKIKIFKNTTRTQKTVFLVMMTTYGVKENKYYEEIVDGQLKMDVLFQ